MLSARYVLRNALIVCTAAIIGLVVSVAVAAEGGDFPLVFASQARVQSRSTVQSASGVIKTLHRLALEEGYTDTEADALVVAVDLLIDSNVPPGAILQISRELLSDLSAADLLIRLEELGQLIADGVPTGQAVNEILKRGNRNNRNGNGNDDEDDDDGNGNGNNGNGNDDEDDDDGNGNGNSGNGNDDEDDDDGNGNGNSGNGNGNNGNGNGNNGNGNGNNGNGSNGNGNNGGGNGS